MKSNKKLYLLSYHFIKLLLILSIFIFSIIDLIGENNNHSFRIDILDNPAPGYLLVSPNFNNITLFDNSGVPVYNKLLNKHYNPTIIKSHPNNLFTFFSLNQFIVVDKDYRIIDSIKCTNNFTTDFHDIIIDSNGNYYLMGFEQKEMDLSKVIIGGQTDAVVTGNIIQCFDKNKNLFFEWNSFEHLNITDVTRDVDLTQLSVDFTHFNSFALDKDKNLLISIRNLDEIIKVDIKTGEILWRMGGKESKNNEFDFVDDSEENNNFYGFSHQHSLSILDNGNILMLDNGNLKTPPISRVVEYKIDHQNKIVSKVWEYRHSPNIFSLSIGNVQRLSNGNTLISWGTNFNIKRIICTEVKKDGTIALEMINDSINDRLPYSIIKYEDFMDSDIQYINNLSTYNFNNRLKNIFAKLDITNLNTPGQISIEKHYYKPYNLEFEKKEPKELLPRRWVLSKTDIGTFTGRISIKLLDSIFNFDKNKISIYQRTKEGSGKFFKLDAKFNQDKDEVFTDISYEGEIVLCKEGSLPSPNLTSPLNASEDVPTSNSLIWENCIDADFYRVQVAKDIDFSNIIIDTLIFNSNKSNYNSLNIGTHYFWRVQSLLDSVNSQWSEKWSFKTSDVNLLSMDNSSSTPTLSINPNPANDQLVVEYISNSNEKVNIELINMNGNILKKYSENIFQGRNYIKLNLSYFSNGCYVFRLIQKDRELSKLFFVYK